MTLRNGIVDLNVTPVLPPLSGSIVTLVANGVVAQGVGTIEGDATAGVFQITFAPTPTNARQKVTIVKIDATNNQINVSDGVNIIGALFQQNQAIDVQSTGTRLLVS